MLSGYDNILLELDPKMEEVKDIVHVYDVSELDFRLINDMNNERIICYKG
ncbi:MAG: hypothetical protein J5657_05295 [Clostridiales bacterium]|nr:hypothetical protein [Clostridiales bacterium]